MSAVCGAQTRAECLERVLGAEGQDQEALKGPALGMYLSLDVCGSVLRLHLLECCGNKSNLAGLLWQVRATQWVA